MSFKTNQNQQITLHDSFIQHLKIKIRESL